MAWYGEDEDDYDHRGRRPSPPRRNTDNRRNRHYLNADMGPLYRARSQGQSPIPAIVNVYNDVAQDNYQRAESPYPPSPRYRGRNSLGEDLADALDDLALDRRRSSPRRSRSRGRSDFSYDRREDYYDWERRRKSEEERLRREIERENLQREKDEKEMKERVIDDYKRRQREDEEEEKRIRDKIKQEEIEAKEKAKKQREEVEAKQREEKAKEEREKKEEQEKIDEALREHYLNRGYGRAYADRQVELEKMRRERTTTVTAFGGGLGVGLGGGFGNALVPAPRLGDPSRAPTYAKIKREHIAIETLTYFGIEWEYDRKDKRYIIILQEMTDSETQLLFDHTRQLREKKLPLLLEPAKEKPQYAMYRKRDRSSSRVRKVGILKYEG